MEIKIDVTLPFPRELVWVTYRDRLPELTEYLPDIGRIDVKSREERGGDVHLVNHWFGTGEIPAVVRSFINDEMLSWTDTATWRSADFAVDWRTDVHAFPGVIASSGTNRYFEVNGGTRLEVRGDLTCDAAKVPAVPRLMAKSINAAVEKYFVANVRHNLKEIAKGVGRFLEQHATLGPGSKTAL